MPRIFSKRSDLDVVAGLAIAWFLKHLDAAENRDQRWNADRGERISGVLRMQANRDFDSVLRISR